MITFQDVSFAYSGEPTKSIENLNLRIGKGECVVFCGRSGSGKTSAIRLANGLIPMFFGGTLYGKVLLKKMEIAQTPLYLLAEHIGSVFQNPRNQFFNVDTDSEIAFGMENRAMPAEELRQRVQEVARELKIEHLLNRNIFSLSGGEKQKIAFASVYAMNPEVYVLDEPSSNLDMQAIEDLRGYLSLLKKQGKTILIAEHILSYLLSIADRFVYFENGKATRDLSPTQLYALSAKQRKSMGLREIDASFTQVRSLLRPAFQNVLAIKELSICRKNQQILEDVNLQVARGEIIAITGSNGAGKTTFLRTLCGLHKESNGSIAWCKQIKSRKWRQKLSYMVMQDVNYQLFAESVYKECTLGIEQPNLEMVEKTLKALGLWQQRDQHPNTLSGGQKQRLAVAVSMICNKEIIVFDEPTSGLDYDSMASVADLLSELAAQGKVIFVATHDYELVSRVCTRVLQFADGRLKEDFLMHEKNSAILQTIFNASQHCNNVKNVGVSV